VGVRATDLVLVLTFGLGLTGCFSPDVSGGPSATDGAPPQADGPGRVVDAAPPPIDACRSCAEAVAAFRFQGTVDDEIAGHHGNQVGAGLAFVPGRAGLALRLGDDASYVHVPDSDTFDLTAGRVSLWFRLGDTPAGDLGLLSRDAGGTEQGGHFNLRVGHDRRVVARIQQQSSPTIEMYRCSTTTIDDNAWHQVEVEFRAWRADHVGRRRGRGRHQLDRRWWSGSRLRRGLDRGHGRQQQPAGARRPDRHVERGHRAARGGRRHRRRPRRRRAVAPAVASSP
jgi:hypothetical protein